MSDGVLRQLALTFASLSLVAIGGANAVVPDIHRAVVNGLSWMDDATFVNLFAIAQAAPGPNVLVVSLIGWHVAGAAGLLVATLAMVGPSCLLAFAVGRAVHRLREARWLRLLQDGLVPIAIGLILSSGLIMARAIDPDALALAITAGAALFVLFSPRNPLWALGAGTLASVVGRWGIG